MKKLFPIIIIVFILYSYFDGYSPYISGSSFGDEYKLRDKSWEGYGKLNSSYQYGKHKFDFDNGNKVVHSIDGKVEDLYEWRINYDGVFEMKPSDEYSYKEFELEFINSYTIKLDGLELRIAY